MRVLLIRPYYDVKYPTSAIAEPLQLEYLAAMVRDKHDVAIYDCIGEGYDEYSVSDDTNDSMHFGKKDTDILHRISAFKPDVVGITCHFYEQEHNLLRVTQKIREKDSSIKIVSGGIVPTNFTEKLFEKKENCCDIAVIGEGEATFKELLDKEFSNLSQIDGVAYKNQDNLFFTKPRELIKDLDTIPLPARDLVPYKNYSKMFLYLVSHHFKFPRSVYKILEKITTTPILDSLYYHGIYEPVRHIRKGRSTRLPSALVMTTRGCPFNCTFCAAHSIWSRVYRQRSAQNVLKELEELKYKYHVRHINILDDNFTISKKRTIDICKEIIDRKLNLTFDNMSGTFVNTLDLDVLKLMKKAGWYEIFIAVESGSDRVLKEVIDKPISLEKVRQVVKWCKHVGLNPGAYFMMGLPGETLQEMQETIDFALDTDFHMVRAYVATPFYGSRMYDECVKKGYLEKSYDPSKMDIFEDVSYVHTPDFTPKQVMAMIHKFRMQLSKQGKLRMNVHKNYEKPNEKDEAV